MITLLRSALFNLFFFVTTFLLTVLVGLPMLVLAPERMLPLARFWAWLILAAARGICGIRLSVSGGEHLPQDGPALIASLHQSAFDTIVWFTLVPRCCYVLKQELTRIPLFGRLLRHIGSIAVDRSAGAKALRGLIREGRRARDQRRQIVIFPEGTRARPGVKLKLQPGVAALAAVTGLQVIPVVTDSGTCWGRRAFRKPAGTIRLLILPPIPAGLERAELMQTLAERLDAGAAMLAGAVDKSVERPLPSFPGSHSEIQ